MEMQRPLVTKPDLTGFVTKALFTDGGNSLNDAVKI
jgi:hypothetical protein